ncbi:MAG: hypothetical protein IPL75_12970 [Acidobacteria bacterium]|nr:hypothetical protein [Acidobacteriota bacterium]
MFHVLVGGYHQNDGAVLSQCGGVERHSTWAKAGQARKRSGKAGSGGGRLQQRSEREGR